MKEENQSKNGCLVIIFFLLLVLAAALVGLPRLPDSRGKAYNSEAKTKIATLTKAQQSYFLDHQKFAKSLTELNDKYMLGINEDNSNFLYSLKTTETSSIHYSIPNVSSEHYGELLYTVGALFIINNEGGKEAEIISIICQSEGKGKVMEAVLFKEPKLIDNEAVCPEKMSKINYSNPI